jgi:pyrroline-5-carboxylate reductase
MREMTMGQLKDLKLGVIGAGSMGGALLRGLLSAGVSAANLTFYDPDPHRQRELDGLGIEAALDNAEVMHCQVVILAVKPQVLGQALDEIQEFARDWHLIISIAAGVTLAQLEEALPEPRFIRAMPNTPLMVHAGMTGLAAGTRARPDDVHLAMELFGAVGLAVVVDEKLMDAVTALSASGTGFVAVFLEALADGGVKMGLPRQLALEMAAQTLLGTARLCLERDLHPAVLKDLVASPGGTTIAGLHALEAGGFRGLVMDAIEAATLKARYLGGKRGGE